MENQTQTQATEFAYEIIEQKTLKELRDANLMLTVKPLFRNSKSGLLCTAFTRPNLPDLVVALSRSASEQTKEGVTPTKSWRIVTHTHPTAEEGFVMKLSLPEAVGIDINDLED